MGRLSILTIHLDRRTIPRWTSVRPCRREPPQYFKEHIIFLLQIKPNLFLHSCDHLLADKDSTFVNSESFCHHFCRSPYIATITRAISSGQMIVDLHFCHEAERRGEPTQSHIPYWFLLLILFQSQGKRCRWSAADSYRKSFKLRDKSHVKCAKRVCIQTYRDAAVLADRFVHSLWI